MASQIGIPVDTRVAFNGFLLIAVGVSRTAASIHLSLHNQFNVCCIRMLCAINRGYIRGRN